MNLFHKIQLFSAVIPFYSIPLVYFTTYFVCWKRKLPFGAFVIRSFLYLILFWLATNFIHSQFVQYLVCFFISLIGNYSLICIQMKEK